MTELQIWTQYFMRQYMQKHAATKMR